jgi:hypothetical protein
MFYRGPDLIKWSTDPLIVRSPNVLLHCAAPSSPWPEPSTPSLSSLLHAAPPRPSSSCQTHWALTCARPRHPSPSSSCASLLLVLRAAREGKSSLGVRGLSVGIRRRRLRAARRVLDLQFRPHIRPSAPCHLCGRRRVPKLLPQCRLARRARPTALLPDGTLSRGHGEGGPPATTPRGWVMTDGGDATSHNDEGHGEGGPAHHRPTLYASVGGRRLTEATPPATVTRGALSSALWRRLGSMLRRPKRMVTQRRAGTGMHHEDGVLIRISPCTLITVHNQKSEIVLKKWSYHWSQHVTGDLSRGTPQFAARETTPLALPAAKAKPAS